MGLLLARTDPGVDRHAGITAFVVPMSLPGIEVRPIREMTGFAEFCEVFLDGVRLGPEHVLGDVNGGWRGGDVRDWRPSGPSSGPTSSNWR